MASTSGLNHPFAAFAGALADAAGQAVMPLYRRPLLIDNKQQAGGFDPVTVADRAAETAIRALIERHHPEHGIIGEEFGTVRADAEYVWVIDPVDGTRAFMSGMPTWGTLIGLLHHGKPVLGVLDQPHLGERFMGDMTRTWRSGRQGDALLQTRKGVALSEAIIWVSSSITANAAMFATTQRLAKHVRMLRYGSDCIAMAMLAEGHIDAVIEIELEIYDIAAQVPIVTGAGGTFTALDDTDPLSASAILAAGDSALHAAISAVINGTADPS
ncbi:MAG: inositol monophosphatase family protein [Bosea sp. (in: a-proteobacteria)]